MQCDITIVQTNLEESIDRILTEIGIVDAYFSSFDSSLQDSFPYRSYNSLIDHINGFETCPEKLDTILAFCFDKLTNTYLKILTEVVSDSNLESRERLAHIISVFTKVRGLKFVTNFFSSDVYILEKLLESIKCKKTSTEEQFMLILWLSKLVLVPFPLDLIRKDATKEIFETSLYFIEDTTEFSKNQRASTILLFRLLNRFDAVDSDLLHKYMYETIKQKWQDRGSYSTAYGGHLMVLKKLLKYSKYMKASHWNDFIYETVVLRETNRIQISKVDRRVQIDTTHVFYLIKIVTYMSNNEVKRKDTNKYTRMAFYINCLIHQIMISMEERLDTRLREAMAKSLAKVANSLSSVAFNYQEQIIKYMVYQLDIRNLQVLHTSISASNIRNNDFKSDLDIDTDQLSVPICHTLLLFLGHLMLNSSFPEHLVSVALSIVHQTLFTGIRSKLSQGYTQIRDSSCFVLWAFYHKFTKEKFRNLISNHIGMIELLLTDILEVIIFDPSFVIRRCGVAVAQEFLGRYGTDFFKEKLCGANSKQTTGTFIITFVETIDKASLNTTETSYLLASDFLAIGFNAEIFYPRLVSNICNDTNSSTIKLSSKLLKRLLLSNEESKYKIVLAPHKGLSYIDITKMIFNYPWASRFSLYACAELYSIKFIADIITNSQVEHINSSMHLDIYHDKSEMAESCLHWLNCLVNNYTELNFEFVWEKLVEISKFDHTQNLVFEMQTFFQTISSRAIAIPDFVFHEFRRSIENSNLLISNSIFFYTIIPMQSCLELLKALSRRDISCDSRACLLDGLTKVLPKLQLLEEQKILIVNCLNDYTNSTQGDVGSKVRMAALLCIQHNAQDFTFCSDIIEHNCIRLSGEVIDNLGEKAFHHLLSLRKCSSEDVTHDRFTSLLKFYHSHILQKCTDNNTNTENRLSYSFWEGSVFSLGALMADSGVVNMNFVKFANLYLRLTENEKEMIFEQLLSFLQPDTRLIGRKNDDASRVYKRKITTLSFLIRIFESNLKLPKKFNYQQLFVRSYNFHINTSNTLRLSLVVNIFSLLTAICPMFDIKKKSMARIIKLAFTHNKFEIRRMCAQHLFELLLTYDATDEFLDLIDYYNWEERDEGNARQTHVQKELERLILCRSNKILKDQPKDDSNL